MTTSHRILSTSGQYVARVEAHEDEVLRITLVMPDGSDMEGGVGFPAGRDVATIPELRAFLREGGWSLVTPHRRNGPDCTCPSDDFHERHAATGMQQAFMPGDYVRVANLGEGPMPLPAWMLGRTGQVVEVDHLGSQVNYSVRINRSALGSSPRETEHYLNQQMLEAAT